MPLCGVWPGGMRMPLVVDHDELALPVDDRPLGGEIERHDRDLLAQDVGPDVELGPVGDAGRRASTRRRARACCRGAKAPGAGSSGPRHGWRERKEKMRSLARLFSSSRRAPPKAASNLWRSSACFSPSVFQMRVWFGPWSNGLMPPAIRLRIAVDDELACRLPRPCGRGRRIMSRNFHVVSTCISGKGGGAGWKAFRARCSMTEESLPIE